MTNVLAIVEMLNKDDKDERMDGVEMLSQFVESMAGSDELLEVDDANELLSCISILIRDVNFKVFQVALTSLSGILLMTEEETVRPHLSSLVPPVIEKMGDGRALVRSAALEALHGLLSGTSSETLVGYMKSACANKNWRVRESAAKFLGDEGEIRADVDEVLPAKDVVAALAPLLEDTQSGVKEAAMAAIQSLYETIGEPLVVALQRVSVRSSALQDMMDRLASASVRDGVVPSPASVFRGGSASSRKAAPRPSLAQVMKGASAGSASSMGSSGSDISVTVDRASSGASISNGSGGGSAVGMGRKRAGGVAAARPRSATSADRGVEATTTDMVEPIRIDNDRDLQQHVEKIRETIESSDAKWDARCDALHRLTGILNGGCGGNPEYMVSALKQMKSALVNQLTDLRSKVQVEACTVLAAFSETLGESFAPFVDFFIPTMLKLAIISIQVVTENASYATRTMIANATAPKVINVLLDVLNGSKSSIQRQRCLEYILLCLESWPADPRLLHKSADPLERMLLKELSAAESEVRHLARLVYWAFCDPWPDRGRKLMSRLDPQLVRLLNDAASGRSMEGSGGSSGSLGVGGGIGSAGAGPGLVGRSHSSTVMGPAASHPLPRRQVGAGRAISASVAAPVSSGAPLSPGAGSSSGSRPLSAPGKDGLASLRQRAVTTVPSRVGRDREKVKEKERDLEREKEAAELEEKERRAARRVPSSMRKTTAVHSGPTRVMTGAQRVQKHPQAQAAQAPTQPEDSRTDRSVSQASHRSVSHSLPQERELKPLSTLLQQAEELSGSSPWTKRTQVYTDIRRSVEQGGPDSAAVVASKHLHTIIERASDNHPKVAAAALDLIAVLVSMQSDDIRPAFEALLPAVCLGLPPPGDQGGGPRENPQHRAATACMEAITSAYEADVVAHALVGGKALDLPGNKTIQMGVMATLGTCIMQPSAASFVASSKYMRLTMDRLVPILQSRLADLRAGAVEVLAALYETKAEVFARVLAGMPFMVVQDVKRFMGARAQGLDALIAEARDKDKDKDKDKGADDRDRERLASRASHRASSREKQRVSRTDSAAAVAAAISGSKSHSQSHIPHSPKATSPGSAAGPARAHARDRDREWESLNVEEEEEEEEDEETVDVTAAKAVAGVGVGAGGNAKPSPSWSYDPSAYKAKNGNEKASARKQVDEEEYDDEQKTDRPATAAQPTSAEWVALTPGLIKTVMESEADTDADVDDAAYQRRAALHAMARMSAAPEAVDVWEHHFGQVLLAVLRGVQDSDADIRLEAVGVVRAMLENQREFLAGPGSGSGSGSDIDDDIEAEADGNLLRVVSDTLLQSRAADETAQVVSAVDDALHYMADTYEWRLVLELVMPMVQSGVGAVVAPAVRLLSRVLSKLSDEVIDGLLDEVLPGLFEAFKSEIAEARKAVVFCLVDLYMKLGDRLTPFLASLSTTQLKLVTIYINRQRKASQEKETKD